MRRWLVACTLIVTAVAWRMPMATPAEIPPSIKAELAFLKAFVARDPEADARLAISKGNLDFLGVAGFSVTVPAGDEFDIGGCLERSDKVKLIRGTSDVVYGDEHMRLMESARHYAARYNAVIANRRGISVAGGCSPSNTGVQRSPAGGRR